MTRRIVRLLAEPPKLTRRQLAQRKYKQSAKGRAASARAKAKQRLKPDHPAKEYARVKAWRVTNAVHYRVYNRVYRRRRRQEQQAGA